MRDLRIHIWLIVLRIEHRLFHNNITWHTFIAHKLLNIKRPTIEIGGIPRTTYPKFQKKASGGTLTLQTINKYLDKLEHQMSCGDGTGGKIKFHSTNCPYVKVK